MGLLFTLAHWHGLAKLRQHTDLSLNILESVTIQLGNLLRNFQSKTCTAYATHELKREMAARIRKATKGYSAGKLTTTGPNIKNTEIGHPTNKKVNNKTKKDMKRQYKTLNLNTYKDHSLGDYVETIRQYGTTDSYSTELVRK